MTVLHIKQLKTHDACSTFFVASRQRLSEIFDEYDRAVALTRTASRRVHLVKPFAIRSHNHEDH